ncbi:MAG: hypothetical protein ACRERD_00250, partial [Candidatus Binatia bacterium]
KESCEGDPCAAVREAIAQGVKMEVHVVGFDVTPEEAEQLKCVAKAGNGKYFAAGNAKELGKALAQVKEAVTAPPKEEKKQSGFGIGTLEFKWPGGDCWNIDRGEVHVNSHCGTAKQALQAGTYTIKPRNNAVFEPFEITIQDGVTTTAP